MVLFSVIERLEQLERLERLERDSFLVSEAVERLTETIGTSGTGLKITLTWRKLTPPILHLSFPNQHLALVRTGDPGQ
jgi:hypothetical protein